MAPERWERWVAGFRERHGEVRLRVDDNELVGLGADESRFNARLPFDRRYDAAPTAADFAAAAVPPSDWGLLLVRKGGFAVARLHGGSIVASKVGQRHVQGRTKAGGQSQQRFARRRSNQARVAYEAAADHAARILTADGGPGLVVTGGDVGAIRAVLDDGRLAALPIAGQRLPIPDPRRRVLEQAVSDAAAILVSVENRATPERSRG